jgi:hypothetical protein
MVKDTMSRIAGFLFCLLAPLGASACELQVHNASGVDLFVLVGNEASITVAPGESEHFPVQEHLWIDFGADAHEYDISTHRAILCPAGVPGPVRIRAQPDGSLWLDSPAPQPKGFPLRPSHVADLTGSPSNNSFKPKPLRGSA